MSEDKGQSKHGIVATVAAVASSFFGVRGGKAHAEDMAKLNPVAVIATGIGLAVLFVISLIWLVRFVLAK